MSKLNSVTGRSYLSATPHTATGESGCQYGGGDANSPLTFSIGVYYGGGDAKFNDLQTGLALGDPAVPMAGLGEKAVDVTYAVIAEFGTDVAFASDDEHPGTTPDIAEKDYITMIKILSGAQ